MQVVVGVVGRVPVGPTAVGGRRHALPARRSARHGRHMTRGPVGDRGADRLRLFFGEDPLLDQPVADSLTARALGAVPPEELHRLLLREVPLAEGEFEE